VIHPSSMM